MQHFAGLQLPLLKPSHNATKPRLALPTSLLPSLYPHFPAQRPITSHTLSVPASTQAQPRPHRPQAYCHFCRKELCNKYFLRTHLINRHAVQFIRDHKDQPFCLYVAHEAIHNPNQGPDDPPIRGPKKRPSKELSPLDEAVKAMCLAMDDGVGTCGQSTKAAQAGQRRRASCRRRGYGRGVRR